MIETSAAVDIDTIYTLLYSLPDNSILREQISLKLFKELVQDGVLYKKVVDGEIVGCMLMSRLGGYNQIVSLYLPESMRPSRHGSIRVGITIVKLIKKFIGGNGEIYHMPSDYTDQLVSRNIPVPELGDGVMKLVFE